MGVRINAAQRLGLGVSVSIALSDIAERHRIRLEQKDIRNLSEMITLEIVDRGVNE